MYYKIIRGYNAEDYISIEKSELEKLSQVIDTRGWAGISNDHVKPTKGVKVSIEQKSGVRSKN